MKKRSFLWLTGMFILATLSFVSCSDDDEGIAGNANELIVGTWQSTRFYGYEIYEGEREDYDEAYTDDWFSFYNDGSGTYTDLGDNFNWNFKWVISGNNLILAQGTAEEERYTIKKLNSSELEIEYSGKEDDEEWCYREIYKRID